MLHRYGAWVARRARLILVLGFVAVVAAGVLGAGAFGKLKNGGFDDPGSQSTQAQQLIDSHFGGQSNLVLLVRAHSGSVDDPAVAAAGRAVAQQLSSEANVTGVVSYFGTGAPALRSTDGTQALILGHITADDSQLAARSKDVIATVAGDRGPVTVLAG